MVPPTRRPLRGIDPDDALRSVLEGTASQTGEPFFCALVKNLALALNVEGAWVTEYLEEAGKLRALAFWLNGQFVDYEYTIEGTPCEVVMQEGRLVHVAENVVRLYPHDADLVELKAVSYMGVPLPDVDGKPLGNLAVFDTRPLPDQPRHQALFRIFAARASAEHQRLRAESKVRQREEKLSLLLDSAMDAIIELDQDLTVTLINRAAEKAFNCPATTIVGDNFSHCLTEQGRRKLARLIRELEDRAEGPPYLWIPGGLEARYHDGEAFPAEATLSRFERQRKPFYTLILRNVQQRLAAERTIRSLRIETEYLKEEIKALHDFDDIIGESPAMLAVLRDVERVAETDATVLLLGETGTGKELVARAVHSSSRRSDKALIRVNCPAIPSSLIESEFFGHEKGAFTGATARREGRFALADQGSIFLDEVGELPLDLQSKLLRVLQEGEFEAVGSSSTKKVDARVIAATNRDLRQAVSQGQFRDDLYYRLNVFPIRIPPLRERGDDVILLARSFARKSCRQLGRTIRPLSDECLRCLREYPWPGNVRELENVIERAVITSAGGKLNLQRALPGADETGRQSPGPLPASDSDRILTLQQLRELERSNIVAALQFCGWRVSGPKGAAQLLGMKPSTLSSRIKALEIKPNPD